MWPCIRWISKRSKLRKRYLRACYIFVETAISFGLGLFAILGNRRYARSLGFYSGLWDSYVSVLFCRFFSFSATKSIQGEKSNFKKLDNRSSFRSYLINHPSSSVVYRKSSNLSQGNPSYRKSSFVCCQDVLDNFIAD